MLLDPETHGLRRMKPVEAALFAAWEKMERPYPWTEGQFLETLSSETQTTLVFENEERLAGFGVLQSVGSEAYLLNIMIRPELRRKGLGDDLLRRLIKWAKDGGADHVLLDVDPSNAPALGLYSKLGFRAIGRRPHGYPRGEPSLLMQKDL